MPTRSSSRNTSRAVARREPGSSSGRVTQPSNGVHETSQANALGRAAGSSVLRSARFPVELAQPIPCPKVAAARQRHHHPCRTPAAVAAVRTVDAPRRTQFTESLQAEATRTRDFPDDVAAAGMPEGTLLVRFLRWYPDLSCGEARLAPPVTARRGVAEKAWAEQATRVAQTDRVAPTTIRKSRTHDANSLAKQR